MMRTHRVRVLPLVALALIVNALALAGCYNPFSPRIAPSLGTTTPPPVPSSPIGVLQLFEWCYNNKAIAEYREIFSDDYVFYFSLSDDAGREYLGTPWTREDELISATQLFVGGSATQPPASSIRLVLDKNFFVNPDPFFTATDPVGRQHKNIRTTVQLTIETSDGGALGISGAANFYLVRGDVALIPEELRLRGFGPDENRWYIRRWDDETARPPEGGALAAGSGSDAAPASLGQVATTVSWGAMKVYYRRSGDAPVPGVAVHR